MMRMRNLGGSIAALAMVATPVVASAAPANPAASLSVAGSTRSAAPMKASNRAMGGLGIGALIAAGVAAIVVVAIVTDDDDSDSN